MRGAAQQVAANEGACGSIKQEAKSADVPAGGFVAPGGEFGVALHHVAHLQQGLQPLVRLAQKVGVALKVVYDHRIVDVLDGNARRCQTAAKEHVFVAVAAYAFVERMRQHHIAAHQKVGGTKVLVGP